MANILARNLTLVRKEAASDEKRIELAVTMQDSISQIVAMKYFSGCDVYDFFTNYLHHFN